MNTINTVYLLLLYCAHAGFLLAQHSLTRDGRSGGTHGSVLTAAGHQSKGERHVDGSCVDNVEVFTERYDVT